MVWTESNYFVRDGLRQTIAHEVVSNASNQPMIWYELPGDSCFYMQQVPRLALHSSSAIALATSFACWLSEHAETH
jgi:hypothetical protein